MEHDVKGAPAPVRGYLLADVAVALGVRHEKALSEVEELLRTCPVLASEVKPVTGHASRGGHWVKSVALTMAGLMALVGFIEVRQRTRLVQGVFSHPYRLMSSDEVRDEEPEDDEEIVEEGAE